MQKKRRAITRLPGAVSTIAFFFFFFFISLPLRKSSTHPWNRAASKHRHQHFTTASSSHSVTYAGDLWSCFSAHTPLPSPSMANFMVPRP